MSQRRPQMPQDEPAPAYMLSRAQWVALFDLYLGCLIIVARKRTMEVLGRKLLVTRQYNHDRWRLTDRGRVALKSAPAEFNPIKSRLP